MAHEVGRTALSPVGLRQLGVDGLKALIELQREGRVRRQEGKPPVERTARLGVHVLHSEPVRRARAPAMYT